MRLALPRRSGARAASAGKAPRQCRLLLLRHAESEPVESGGRDIDRPLTPNGVQAAGELAMSLAEGGWGAPDLILCSDSRRTRQTFAAMQAAMPALSDVRTEFMGSFYIVSSLDRETRRHIEDAVCAVADSGEHSEEGCGDCGLRTVWAVGHNKGWSEAASELAGEAVQLVEASAVGLTREADSWEGALRESKGQWGIDAHFFVGGAGSAVEENSGGDGAPNGGDWPLPA